MTNSYLEELCASYNLKKLIKQPTCFKNLENPTCTDHILANHPKSFHSPSVFVTCLSDFHKLTLTVLNVFDLLPNRLKNSKTDKTPAKVSTFYINCVAAWLFFCSNIPSGKGVWKT